MYLNPCVCVYVLLLFQDVAVRVCVAAGGLSSGPSGRSHSGRPVGAVEGHTQERIQRPGQCVFLFPVCILQQNVTKCTTVQNKNTARFHNKRVKNHEGQADIPITTLKRPSVSVEQFLQGQHER